MSRWRSRLGRALGAGGDPAEIEQMNRRLDESTDRTCAELDRQEALIRELATDLTERVAAIERRLGALEARDQ